jgi:hypothetical protein
MFQVADLSAGDDSRRCLDRKIHSYEMANGTSTKYSPSKFGLAKRDARATFDSIAEEGLSVCADAAIFKRWLDDAEVKARNTYLAHKSPVWGSVGQSMNMETREAWLEPGEAELLADKREYERNLKNLDVHFPARKQFWLERYAREWRAAGNKARAVGANPLQGIAVGAMADLPELSGSTIRKLAIRWDSLLNFHRLDGEHLQWHEKERRRLCENSGAHRVRSRDGSWHVDERLVDRVGIAPTVALAKARFRDLTGEYWWHWSASFGHEAFAAWIDVIKGQTLAEVAAVWKGKADKIDRWYERACLPEIEKALPALVKEYCGWARVAELRALDQSDNKGSTSSMVRFGMSRPVAIIRSAGTPEELRWDTSMGGDFDKKALFQTDDRVMTGDAIHCDIFDQLRVIVHVKPVFANGEVAYWEADIAPRSEWNRQFQIGLPGLNQPPLGAFQPRPEYPKYMYHTSQQPQMVFSAQQQAALGPEWSEIYIYQEYPRVKYHWTKAPVTVKSAEEEKALGGEWSNTSTAFAPYKTARPARTEQHDPTKWVSEWSVAGLTPEHREQIKAQLWRADGVFARSPDPDSAALAAMQQAFDDIARVLFDSGILTEQLLKNEIPLFVWDSAIAGGWWHRASESRQDIFPEQLGHYWVFRDDSRDWNGLFRAEAAEWRAELVEWRAILWEAVRDQEANLAGTSVSPSISAGPDDLAAPRMERDSSLGGDNTLKPVQAEKGNWDLLRAAGGKLKRSVTFAVAGHFGGVTKRAIEKAAKKGALDVEGKRPNRRVLVKSLLKYFPPETNAN